MEEPAIKRSLDDVLRDIHERLSFMHHETIGDHTRGLFDDTPLHLAAREGDLEGVTLLLAAGSDPNAKGDFGFTPLHDAVLGGHAQIVSVLLAHGSSPSVTEINGITPAVMAKQRQNETLIAIFSQ